MSVFRNGMLAILFLTLGGCMMMDMHKPHGTPMEIATTGHATDAKNAPQHAAPTADPGGEKKAPAAAAAPHSSTPSGMAIVGGVLMVVMMLAMML